MTTHSKTKKGKPNAQSAEAIKERYFSWLIQRETKRIRRFHFIGKRPIRSHSA